MYLRDIAVEPQKVKTFFFKSWEDFLQQVEYGESDMEDCNRQSLFTAQKNIDFTQTANMAEAIKLGREGWDKEYYNIDVNMFDSVISLVNRSTEVGMSIVGPGTIDMGRYMMGHPEPYYVFNENDNYNYSKTQTINITGAIGSRIDESVIYINGLVLVCLIDSLERQNVRVELNYHFGSASHATREDSSHIIEGYIRVKETSDPLDSRRVLFCLSHPSMARRLCFAILEQADEEFRDVIGISNYRGYGLPIVPEQVESEDVNFCFVNSNEDFISQIKSQMVKYDIDVDWDKVVELTTIV